MKHGVVVTAQALAALLVVGCAGSQKQLTAPQQAALQAEQQSQEAQKQAQKEREKAQKANAQAMKQGSEAQQAGAQAQQANAAQHQADMRASDASHRAGVAEAQAAEAAHPKHPGAAAPSAGAAERQGAGGAAEGRVVVITAGLLFETNKADLAPGATHRLDQVADALKAQPTPQHVTVEGFTDDRGSAQHNKDLSQRRAETVANYLERRGVPKDQITVKGLGSSEPASTESTPTGRQINRRVEIVVQPAAAMQQQQQSPQQQQQMQQQQQSPQQQQQMQQPH
jgi:outer membrane protein OmpA-like peptidoglycan-associated protein